MDLLRFVVLIGALVFVHELGHFLVARLFGIRVLTFALGFGPRLFGVRLGGTDYCVRLIPLGGFVRMLGEEPDDVIEPALAKQSFHEQSVARRFLVVLAGPAMSLAFPAILYFAVFIRDTDLTPPVIGTVVPGNPAEGRLLPGDRVLAVDGTPIESFEAMVRVVSASPGRPLRFHVRRGDGEVDTVVTPATIRLVRPLDVVEYQGRAGISSRFPLPVVALRPGPSPAANARLKTFDLITAYAGRPVARRIDLERMLDANRGVTVPVAFLRPHPLTATLGGLCDLEVFDPGITQLTPDPGTGDVLARTGIESADLLVADVAPQSAEREMGLRRGDRILTVDGVAPAGWEGFRDAVVGAPDRRHVVAFRHEGREVVGEFSARRRTLTDEFGQQYTQWVLDVSNWQPTVGEAPIPNPAPVRYAMREAVRQSQLAMRFLSLSIVRIFQGRVSIRAVGGPIMIYDAARATVTEGFPGFLNLMALVSVNLGMLNLLPIPILDGGQLAFVLAEAVLRRPVPLRVRRAASIFGLVFLVLLMGLALRNDLSRRFASPPSASAGRAP